MPNGPMRASDHDRELVADVLNTAYAEGRITHEELTERLDATWAAKTFDQLAPITGDLVGRAMPTQYATPLPATPATGDELRLGQGHGPQGYTAILGDSVAERGTHLLANTRITCVMGDVRLDLRGGTTENSSPEINVFIVMGDLEIDVPAGVAVVDHTSKVMGDSKLRGLAPQPGGPVITITGVLIMGDVKVSGPDDSSWGKRRRNRRR